MKNVAITIPPFSEKFYGSAKRPRQNLNYFSTEFRKGLIFSVEKEFLKRDPRGAPYKYRYTWKDA
jgi:hypothetical protein